MNAILPDLEALLDSAWAEVQERDLEPMELIHVYGWILDRIAMPLPLGNNELAMLFTVHAKEMKNPKHPFWSRRQKAVEEMWRRAREA
jgi:hypothetical protein